MNNNSNFYPEEFWGEIVKFSDGAYRNPPESNTEEGIMAWLASLNETFFLEEIPSIYGGSIMWNIGYSEPIRGSIIDFTESSRDRAIRMCVRCFL